MPSPLYSTESISQLSAVPCRAALCCASLPALLQEAIEFVKSIHDDICEHANIIQPEDALGLPEPQPVAGGEISD